MEPVADRVKKIIVDQLGVEEETVTPEASFVEIMNEYKSKKRNHAVMQTIAGRLSQDEIAALAAYFGSVKPAPTKPEGGKS